MMNATKIADLIKNSPSARDEVEQFAQYASDVFAGTGQPARTMTAKQGTELLANYIAAAIEWNLALESAAKAEHAKLGERPRGRIGVIEQLERIGEVFGWNMVPGGKQPKLRDRPIPGDVMEALQKKGVLGPALISHVEAPDGRGRKNLQFLPLGISSVNEQGTRVQEEHDGTVFGFHDPSHLTADEKANSRKLKRKFAFASKFDAPAVLRVDQISWSLDDQPRQAIENAQPFIGGIFPGLKSVRDRLQGRGLDLARKNLAIVARTAARFLEIEFQITDRNRDNQSHETIASWTKPYPFAEFAITIFEMLAPTRHGESLADILMPGNTRGDLKGDTVDLVLEGTQHTRRILGVLAEELRLQGIHIAPTDLFDPDDGDNDDAAPTNAHYLDRGSPVMRISENKRTTAGRLDDGRRRILEQLWSLRDNSVKLRGFTEMFYAYHHKLLERGDNVGPLRNEMLKNIINPTLDWYRELGARFEEGVAYKADIKRRAGGLPNEVPEVPAELERHRMALAHYPAMKTWGAQRDDVAIDAILKALDPSGHASSVWQEVGAIVDDEAA